MALSKDAIGDLSGIKGTEYHLLYALWLLLCGGANRIWFYEGNDLLASPIAPPKIAESEDSPPISLHAQESQEDIWIQLKSTESPWTRSSFLPANTKDDNLLKNFICNAARSESEGRSWRVVLGTQGFIHRNELETFVSQPADFPDLNKRLVEIVDRAYADLEKTNFLRPKSDLLKLSAKILSQLAKGKATSREMLLAETELKLAYACYDRDLAVQAFRALLGAMLSDASALPASGHTYDLNWINQVAGFVIEARGLFDTDPVRSCSHANARVTPRDWNPSYFASRARLEKALDQFLLAQQTLFVLVGRSGSGKSWSVTDWAARTLNERMRLCLPGTTLDQYRELSTLVAETLRSQTSSDGGNEKLLRRFQGASRVEGRGAGVIIIDDLLVRSTDLSLAHDLTSLVKQCRDHDIKLVLTCQEQIWKRHQLWKEISPDDLYVADIDAESRRDSALIQRNNTEKGSSNSPDENLPQPKAIYSFDLGDFTPEELTAALGRRFPHDQAERAGLLLAAPSYAPLRNPYLLTRYLEIHGTALGSGAVPPTVSIDGLLDARITQVLESAAQTLSLSVTDVQPAFETLTETLWNSRSNGVPYSASIGSISQLLPEQAGDFISQLREKGFLTWESPLTIVEQPIADRLFARHLAQHNEEVSEICNELQTDEDSGVVAALMRGSKYDPIKLAERLIATNKQWINAVSDGLAQCDPRDYRVLGFLVALMHSDAEKVFIIDAATALGQLAARDRLALRFVTSMYLSASGDRYGAEYALGSAMEFDPPRVAAAMRLKLSRAARAKGVFPSDLKKERDRILRGALEPLSLIKNRTAAEVGRQLLRRYEYLAGRNEHDRNYKFLEDIDSARGRIALYDDHVFDQLLCEIKSEDQLIRYRAACAIRAPAIEQPLRVQPALHSAMLRDPEYVSTINRILLAAYPLVKADPSNLLKSLSDSRLTKWDKPLSTAQVLGLLGDLSLKLPDEVYKLLPKRLDHYHPGDRALASEMLSYAWWRCAEHVSEAQYHLSNLTTPDLADVPSELVPFAIRGAAIAQLGLICLSEGVVEELAGEQYFYPLGELIYTYLNTRRFMRRHATAILAHPSYSKLRDLLFQAVREGEPVNINPLQQTLVQSVFRSVVLSLEMLTTLADTMPNPMLLLNDLPRDWRALHMASELLDSGRREQSLIEFTETLCEEVRHGWTTMQAGAEREKCLAQLAALKSDQHVALEEHRAIIDDHFFQVTGKMRGLASLIDAHPEDTLVLLDKGIQDSSDQASLFFLKEETRYWAALLLGRLYARMFDSRMIRPKEAAEWCELVLEALTGLPSSIHKDEYQNVYTCIQSWLKGGTEPPKPLPHRDESMLGDSHVLATSILMMGYEAISQRKSSVDLDEVLSDRRGWNEGEFVVEDDTISRSSSSYLNYVFPAVRLALIALAQRFSFEDPAGRLLSERKSTHDLLLRHQHIFREQPNNNHDDHYTKELKRAISDFQERLKLTPRDETLLLWCGGALLRAERFTEAAQILSSCIALPSCGEDTKASAFYDLACVKARLGLESECRTLLEKRARVKPLDKEHMRTDPDFDSLRDRSWFRDMIASN